MRSKYKSCAVPLCENTSIATPNKVFVNVPIKKEIRLTWLKLAWRNPDEISKYTTLHFCEDHFDLPNDMENYMEYHVMGSVSQVRMKVGCMPKKFKCQPDRTRLTSDTTKELCEVKKQRMKTLDECEKRFEENSIVTELSEEMASGSSAQHNVEEVPQLTPRVLDTTIHFKTQLPNDMDNHMRYRILGTVAQVRMIPGCTLTKFECQPDRKRRTCGGKERPYILKKNAMKAVEECMNKSEITTSCSSLQDTSNINCHTVEEHAEDILCKQEEKSVQIMTLKSEIKEDFENKSQDDDILNLHTTIDIKPDIEDIDSSVANHSSASTSRTNSACGSPTRESRNETFTEYEPQTTIDVPVMKGSSLSDVSINRPCDILTEVAADVYQQQTKTQSQQNKQLTQIRHANCERQRRYREKQRAAKMKACATFSGSSEVQQHKRRPQTNAERLRKHRKLLREKKQQQQMEEQKAQELVTQKNVDHNSHQDDLKDLHPSDPSLSTDSSSQTIMTLQREINKDSDLHESHEDDILNLHVEIRQEDIDDIEASIPIPTYLILKKNDQHIDSSVANLSSASCSQTNSACGSPTRESRNESFIEYVPQTTIDVTVMEEVLGNPSSDLSIHLDAADSSEEETIEIKLRKKMAMLSQNEEIIKRRREEIIILEENNKQLLADIKYLQDVAKKKYYYP